MVDPDHETEFLHPLPVQALWGVGKVTADKLRNAGLVTVGDVAALSPENLITILGKASGRHLYALAHHQDPRPVETGKRRGSVGSQQALGRSRKTPQDLESLLLGIVDRVTRRLRSGNRVGRTVVLRLRFEDFTRATRPTRCGGRPVRQKQLPPWQSRSSTKPSPSSTRRGLRSLACQSPICRATASCS